MPDIVLFGATGYTGRLTAEALARRGASFAIAGRDSSKLESLARRVNQPPVHQIPEGDASALVEALQGAKVLITCVGPFVEHGDTAAQAAVEAGVHYIDSTGEGPFVSRLYDRYDAAARRAGITMAPAMGFDEVPGDVACTLAAGSMAQADLHVTYALPRTGSTGTVRSTLGIVSSEGPWLEEGRIRMIRAGEVERWAPMPHPLGPRRAISFPLAIGHFAPRHLELEAFRCFVTIGAPERVALRFGAPLLRLLHGGPARPLLEKLAGEPGAGPSDEARATGWWTILAEAQAGDRWHNVALTGTDVYGLTAHLLAAAGLEMADSGYQKEGVLSPVQAIGLDKLRVELESFGVTFDDYAPV